MSKAKVRSIKKRDGNEPVGVFKKGGRVKKFAEGGKVPKTIMENLRQTHPVAAAVGDFAPIVSSVVNAAEYAQHMRNGAKYHDQDSFDQAKWDAAGIIPFAKPVVRLSKGFKHTVQAAKDQARKQIAEASRATNIQNTSDYFLDPDEEYTPNPKSKLKKKSPMYATLADTAEFRAKRDKPKGMKKGGSTNWIAGAIKKPGALRASLGVKGDKPIPAKKLAKAAKAPGKLGQRARLAQTLKKFNEGGSVNEAGNYTKPGLRKKIVSQVKAAATHGTKAGQWSARKAQLVAKRYKDAGGGYTD